MENKRKYKINWTDIYSLGLLPAILIWGLSPLFAEQAISVTSIFLGIGWIIIAQFCISRTNECGIIGWITGWSLSISGIIVLLLSLLGVNHIPHILFEAPCIALLSYLFKRHNITPRFCKGCIKQQSCIQELYLPDSFSCYEVRYIVKLILIGALISTGLSWGLFLWGVETDSRAGTYFYFYFPMGLGIALVLFETIRRTLIQYLIGGYESKYYITHPNQDPQFMNFFFTEIRIMIIGDEKIFLIESNDKEFAFHKSKKLDLPISDETPSFLTQKEKALKARQIVREKLGIENPNLQHIYTTINLKRRNQVGHYILFLPSESLPKLEQYPGRWYTVSEINNLFRNNKLEPLFQELYARFYTIVQTARTYHSNGKRRYAIRGYKPAFSLHNIDQLNIVFDDPLWLYVSRHNEDHLLYRIDSWLQKLFQKNHSSNDCDA